MANTYTIEIKNRYTDRVIMFYEKKTDEFLSYSTLLGQAILCGVSTGADLSNANLDYADLSGFILVGGQLAGASFFEANLSCSCFRECDLDGAKFEEVEASYAFFEGCSIRQGSFSKSVLSKTFFKSCDVTEMTVQTFLPLSHSFADCEGV